MQTIELFVGIFFIAIGVLIRIGSPRPGKIHPWVRSWWNRNTSGPKRDTIDIVAARVATIGFIVMGILMIGQSLGLPLHQ